MTKKKKLQPWKEMLGGVLWDKVFHNFKNITRGILSIKIFVKYLNTCQVVLCIYNDGMHIYVYTYIYIIYIFIYTYIYIYIYIYILAKDSQRKLTLKSLKQMIYFIPKISGTFSEIYPRHRHENMLKFEKYI